MPVPTSSQLKARYPAFAAVDIGYIDAVIQDAARSVNPAVWNEADVDAAVLALAAHFLASEGALGTNPASSGVLTSDKLGDASQTYGSTQSTSDYSTTSYGRQFRRLQRMNVPMVLTV